MAGIWVRPGGLHAPIEKSRDVPPIPRRRNPMTDEFDVPEEDQTNTQPDVVAQQRQEIDDLKRQLKDAGRLRKEVDGYRAKEREAALQTAATELGLASR